MCDLHGSATDMHQRGWRKPVLLQLPTSHSWVPRDAAPASGHAPALSGVWTWRPSSWGITDLRGPRKVPSPPTALSSVRTLSLRSHTERRPGSDVDWNFTDSARIMKARAGNELRSPQAQTLTQGSSRHRPASLPSWPWARKFTAISALQASPHPCCRSLLVLPKILQTGWLKNQKFIISHPWRLEGPGQGVASLVPPGAPLLGPLMLSSPCALTGSSLCVCLCPHLF